MNESYFFTTELCVGYDRTPVVKNITITLERGEILTLIGPNGAGKSTLLGSIAGQLRPLGGVFCLNAQDLAGMPRETRARQMSVLRLQAELMTCEQVVETGRYPYTGRFGILSGQDHRVVEEAMELVRVLDLRERLFTQISDGQRQRVLLARAIAQEPELLILDEPTSYLDIRYKLEFLSILQRLCRCKKMAVILSLHELELARRVSDQLLCIRDGRVYRFGTPEEVFTPGEVAALFDITAGSYDEQTDVLELPAPAGQPQIFVIGGNGSGREVYRRLQRQNIPFATGILYANDLDASVAHALAAEVVEAAAFEPVDGKCLTRAKKLIDCCQTVICARERFGSMEQANSELFAYAQAAGKL
mgnify:FL=1